MRRQDPNPYSGSRKASDLRSILGLLPGPELCGQWKCRVEGSGILGCSDLPGVRLMAGLSSRVIQRPRLLSIHGCLLVVK